MTPRRLVLGIWATVACATAGVAVATPPPDKAPTAVLVAFVLGVFAFMTSVVVLDGKKDPTDA